MAAVLQPLLPSPRESILLNTPSPSPLTSHYPMPSQVQHTASSNSLSSTSSSMNTVSSSSASNSQRILPSRRNSSSKRIRFAPLPDPRRSILVTESGTEHPLPDTARQAVDGVTFDSGLPSDPNTTLRIPKRSSSAGSLVDSAKKSPVCGLRRTDPLVHPTPRLGEDLDTTHPPAHYAVSEPCTSDLPTSSSSTGSFSSTKTASGLSWTRSKNLLKPFLKRSSQPAPSPSFFRQDLLSLGSVSLSRSPSKDSQNESDTSGSILSRWKSADSLTSKNKSKGKEWFGSSLSRVQSTQSYRGDERHPSVRHPTSTISGDKPSATPATTAQSGSASGHSRFNSRKGTRMLNGRVYGAKRNQPNNVNPFANARDEEPEFVEWGYGGMGSVKSGAGMGSQWSKLQSGSGVMVGSVEERHDKEREGVGVADEEDDGSGMGWLKKRREQREREKREKEAAEDQTVTESEPVVTGTKDHPPTFSSTPSQPVDLDVSIPSSPNTGLDTVRKADKEHHILTAELPPLLRHGSHSRTQSIANSFINSVETSGHGGELNLNRASTSPPVTDKFGEGTNEESESDDEEGDTTSTEVEDDDEEAELTEQMRKTSKCAGFEKISRHKDMKDER